MSLVPKDAQFMKILEKPSTKIYYREGENGYAMYHFKGTWRESANIRNQRLQDPEFIKMFTPRKVSTLQGR